MPIGISQYRVCVRESTLLMLITLLTDTQAIYERLLTRRAGQLVGGRLFMLDFSVDRPIGWNLYAFSINALNGLD